MDPKPWNDKYDTPNYVYTKDVNQFVVEFVKDLAPGTAIDLAGGEGRNAVWMAEQGWVVENIDFAENALKKYHLLAEERGVADRCISTCQSALEFTSQLAPVDLAVVAYLHIYSHQFEVAMANAVAALKPGGIYVIADHRAPAGAGIAAGRELHRIDEAIVVREGTAVDLSKSPEQFAAFLQEDAKFWVKLVKSAGVKLD